MGNIEQHCDELFLKIVYRNGDMEFIDKTEIASIYTDTDEVCVVLVNGNVRTFSRCVKLEINNLKYHPFMPSYEYLYKIGFERKYHEKLFPNRLDMMLKLSNNACLLVKNHFRFTLEMSKQDAVPIFFSCKEELEEFIRQFKK